MSLYPQQAVSEAELADLIRPFVRARFDRVPDPADGNRTGRIEYVLEREAEFARLNQGLRRFARDRDLRAVA